MRRRTLLLPVMAVLAAGAALGIRSLPVGRSSPGVPSSSQDQPPPSPQTLADAAPSDRDPPGALARDPKGHAPEAAGGALFLEEGPPGHLRVDGTIRHPDGSLVRDSGVIRVVGSADPNASSDVVDGRFRLWVAGAGKYRIDVLELGGEAYRKSLPPRDVVDGTTWDVVVEPARAATITVLDDVTGAPLPDALATSEGRDGVPAQVATEPSDPDRTTTFLSLPQGEDLAASFIRADALGRIAFPPTWAPWTVVTVGAPDHAWRVVSIDLASPGPVTVRLGGGGALEVTLRSRSHAPNLAVLAIPADGLAVRVALDAAGHGVQDGLAPGTWSVSVLDALGEAVASRSAIVVAGERTKVEIDLPESQVLPKAGGSGGPRVTLRGTIHLPEAWIDLEETTPLLVNLNGVAESISEVHRMLGMRRRESTSYSFSLDEMPVGRYAVDIEGVPWIGLLDVVPSGAPVTIDVPSPSQLEVRFVDAIDGAPILGATAWWRPHADLVGWLVQGIVCGHIHADGGTTFRVPEGMDGRISVRAPGHLAPSEVRDGFLRPSEIPVAGVHPGARADPIVIRLGRAARIRVRAVGAEGEAVVSWPPGGRPVLVPMADEASGPQRLTAFADFSAGAEFAFTVGAGKWSLECTLPAEYEAVPPREIEARLGETIDLEVRLIPRK